jgi:hypothetical protein
MGSDQSKSEHATTDTDACDPTDEAGTHVPTVLEFKDTSGDVQLSVHPASKRMLNQVTLDSKDSTLIINLGNVDGPLTIENHSPTRLVHVNVNGDLGSTLTVVKGAVKVAHDTTDRDVSALTPCPPLLPKRRHRKRKHAKKTGPNISDRAAEKLYQDKNDNDNGGGDDDDDGDYHPAKRVKT